MVSLASAGSGRLSIHGKRLVAESMYVKGTAFVGAAVLLRREKAYEYVVLHLLCQGTEIVLKALLLLRDYDRYQPQLRRLGHKLQPLVSVAAKEFGTKAPSTELASELVPLSALYSTHRLRYGTFYDILVDPASIPSARLLRKMAAVIRLANRHVRKEAPPNNELQRTKPAVGSRAGAVVR